MTSRTLAVPTPARGEHGGQTDDQSELFGGGGGGGQAGAEDELHLADRVSAGQHRFQTAPHPRD